MNVPFANIPNLPVANRPFTPGGTKLAPFALTAAQINAMNDGPTPVDVIAAPGAGVVLIPIAWFISISRPLNAPWTASPTLHVRWNGIATDIANTLSSGLGTVGANQIQYGGGFWTAAGFSTLATDARNKSLQLMMTGTIAPGGRGGDATAQGFIEYYPLKLS